MADLASRNATLEHMMREKQAHIEALLAKQADWEAELRKFCRADFGYQAPEGVEFDIRSALYYCHKAYCEVYNRVYGRSGSQGRRQTTDQAQQTEMTKENEVDFQIDPALTAEENSQIPQNSDEQLNSEVSPEKNSQHLYDERAAAQEHTAAAQEQNSQHLYDEQAATQEQNSQHLHDEYTAAQEYAAAQEQNNQHLYDEQAAAQEQNSQHLYDEHAATQEQNSQHLYDEHTTTQEQNSQHLYDEHTATQEQNSQHLYDEQATAQEDKIIVPDEILGLATEEAELWPRNSVQEAQNPEIKANAEPNKKDQGIQVCLEVKPAPQTVGDIHTHLEPQIEKVAEEETKIKDNIRPEAVDQSVQVEFDQESDAARNRVLQARLAAEIEQNGRLSEELNFHKAFGAKSVVRPVLINHLKSAWSQVTEEKAKLQDRDRQLDRQIKVNLALHKSRVDTEDQLADYRKLKAKCKDQERTITTQQEQLRKKAEMEVERKASDYWKKTAEGFEFGLKRSRKEIEDLKLKVENTETEKFSTQRQLRKTHEEHAATTKYLRRGLEQKDREIGVQDHAIQTLKDEVQFVNSKLLALRKLYNLSDKGSASKNLMSKLEKQEKQLDSAKTRVSRMEELLISRKKEVELKDSDIERLHAENENLKEMVSILEEDIKKCRVKDSDIERLYAENENLKEMVSILEEDIKKCRETREPEVEISKPSSKKKTGKRTRKSKKKINTVIDNQGDVQEAIGEDLEEKVPEMDQTVNNTDSDEILERDAQQPTTVEPENESEAQYATVSENTGSVENIVIPRQPQHIGEQEITEEDVENIVIPQQPQHIGEQEITEEDVENIIIPQQPQHIGEQEVTEEELQEALDLLELTSYSAQVLDEPTTILAEQTKTLSHHIDTDDRFSDLLRGDVHQVITDRRHFRGGRGRHQNRRVGPKHVKVRNIIWPWILSLLFSLILGSTMTHGYHLLRMKTAASTTYPPIPTKAPEAEVAANETIPILQTVYISTTKLHTELRTVTEIQPPTTVQITETETQLPTTIQITETETQTETATIMQVFPSATPALGDYTTSVVPFGSSLMEQRGCYVKPDPASIAVGSILFVFVAWACRLFR